MGEYQTATLSLAVIDESGPEPVMNVRCWPVPPDIIDGITVNLTLRYGQPDEMIADPRVMARNGQRSAAEDGTVYLFAGEGGSDG